MIPTRVVTLVEFQLQQNKNKHLPCYLVHTWILSTLMQLECDCSNLFLDGRTDRQTDWCCFVHLLYFGKLVVQLLRFPHPFVTMWSNTETHFATAHVSTNIQVHYYMTTTFTIISAITAILSPSTTLFVLKMQWRAAMDYFHRRP